MSGMPQNVEVAIKRMQTLVDTAMDDRLYEQECKAQMLNAIALLKDLYTADGRDRLTQENSLMRSQLTNCNKEIGRLRDALLSTAQRTPQESSDAN